MAADSCSHDICGGSRSLIHAGDLGCQPVCHSCKVGNYNAQIHTAGQKDLCGGNSLEGIDGDDRDIQKTYRCQMATPVDEVVDETFGNWE